MLLTFSLQNRCPAETATGGAVVAPPVGVPPAKAGAVYTMKIVTLLDLRSDDVDDLAATLGAELDRTGREGEERVVAATADVGARVEVGATLTDEDLAREDNLTAEALHAEALCVGVTTVARRTRAFFVCHCCSAP